MKFFEHLFIAVFLFATLVDCDLESNVTQIYDNTTTETEVPHDITTVTVAPSEMPNNWTVEYPNGTICIMMVAKATVNIKYNATNEGKYEIKEKELALDSASVSSQSNCDGLMILDFGANSLELVFMEKDKKISLTNITLKMIFDNATFPNATEKSHRYFAENKNYFEAPVGNSYSCKAETDVSLSDDSKLEVKDLQVEAFMDSTSAGFSSAMECPADDDVSDLVPIAVGCALAGLVVIVLIAYLIGRRHKRQKGYESV